MNIFPDGVKSQKDLQDAAALIRKWVPDDGPFQSLLRKTGQGSGGLGKMRSVSMRVDLTTAKKKLADAGADQAALDRLFNFD